MRLGCGSCLGLILLVAILGAALGAGWIVLQCLQAPVLDIHAVTAADSARAQRKIFEVAQGVREVTLSEQEVNAFLRRNLADLPVESPAVRLLGDDTVDLFGRVPLRRLVPESVGGVLRDVLPERALERAVWVGIRARVAVVGPSRRPALRFDVRRLRVGRQRMPAALLLLTMDPALVAMLHWALPATIESVRVEPERLTIRSAASR